MPLADAPRCEMSTFAMSALPFVCIRRAAEAERRQICGRITCRLAIWFGRKLGLSLDGAVGSTGSRQQCCLRTFRCQAAIRNRVSCECRARYAISSDLGLANSNCDKTFRPTSGYKWNCGDRIATCFRVSAHQANESSLISEKQGTLTMLRQPYIPVEIIWPAVVFGIALLFAAPVWGQTQVVQVEGELDGLTLVPGRYNAHVQLENAQGGIRIGQAATPLAFTSIPFGDSDTFICIRFDKRLRRTWQSMLQHEMRGHVT